MSSPIARRRLLQAAAGLAFAPAAARAATFHADLVEPAMRMKVRSASGATVALTFDACPGGDLDMRIAETLLRHNVPASIFITGAWMREHPDGLAFLRARPDLFSLQNHGDHHIPPVLGQRKMFGIQCASSIQVVHQEVVTGGDEIRAATGIQPRWYRAATGFYSRPALEAIESWGFAIAAYSLNADQGASLPAAQVAHRMANAVDGDVVVAHINQPKRSSGEGAAEGVKALVERGVHFVRLDQLGRADMAYDNLASPHPKLAGA